MNKKPDKKRRYALYDKVGAALALRPMTAEEVADFVGEHLQSISPRFAEMERVDLVERTPEFHTSKANCPRIVWKLGSLGLWRYKGENSKKSDLPSSERPGVSRTNEAPDPSSDLTDRNSTGSS